MWDTNKIPSQGICTIYVGPPVPLEYRKVPLLGLLLAWAWKPGQVSRLGGHPRSRWEFSQKNGEQERMTWGNQSFWKLIPFLYFLSLLIYFLLYIGMNTESHGGQQTWPLSQSDASYKIIQRSNGFYIIFWPWGLLTFYDPFFLITKKLIFSKGVFFLNQAPPSEGSR